jgi:predicted O-methyltransferase YrrM
MAVFLCELEDRRDDLPPAVNELYLRCTRVATAQDHVWAAEAATRAADLVELVRLVRGRRRVVELGTGPAWTTLALAVAEPSARIVSFDPVVHDHRDDYLALVDPSVRDRIEFVQAAGAAGAADAAEPVDLLFIDSTHEHEGTLTEFRAWRDRLSPEAVVVFHDYGHPRFPGVAQAVRDLGLEGDVRGGMFVWRAPA